MSIPMQFNFALLVPKRLNKRQKPASLLKGVGGSNGMDETYVGSPGQRGERRQMFTGSGQMPFSLNVGFSPCAKPVY